MITGVVVALVAVVVILVGFPLLAWWFGNRRFWRRLRPSPAPIRRDDLRQRLGLTAGELTEAQRAARAGQELGEPRMRAAVVAVAEQALERQKAQLIIGRAAGIAGVLGLVSGVALGEFRSGARVFDSVLWAVMVLNLFVQAGTAVLLERRLRRAVQRNRAPTVGHQR